MVVHVNNSLSGSCFFLASRLTIVSLDHGSSAPHHHSCAKHRYRQIYYEAIDTVTEEVRRRFDQSDIRLIREIEVLLLNSANGTSIDTLPQEIENI